MIWAANQERNTGSKKLKYFDGRLFDSTIRKNQQKFEIEKNYCFIEESVHKKCSF